MDHTIAAEKKQRQLKLLHDKMGLQKDFLPPGLTFEQFWARMKHHSRNPRVLKYLCSQQNQMDHIKHECHITDKTNRVKQKQYIAQGVLHCTNCVSARGRNTVPGKRALQLH